MEKQLRIKCYNLAKQLARIHTTQTSVKFKINLFKTYIQPHLLYIAPIMYICNKNKLGKFCTIYNKSLKIILNLK